MKRILFLSLFAILITACTSSTNSPEFISKTEGRYLFNSDESLEIYFENSEMKVKWRGQDMKPIKANDSSFYLKEMNEKLVFVSKPSMHIELAPKREHDGKKYSFSKLENGQKTPSEYFKDGEYDKALQAYLAVKKSDSLDRSVNQWVINNKGYEFMRKNRMEEAKAMFEINIALHPKSSNTYDSMGDFYRKEKDTANAILYYKKALAINPENRSSNRYLKRLTKK